MTDLPAFKAYDVRGRVPDELDEELAYKIGLAYALELVPAGAVATARDARDSSPSLHEALNRGLLDGGADVVDAGLSCTETVYFASSRPGMGGGIMVTASHNPKGYNGIKPVGRSGTPLLGEKGLEALRRRIAAGEMRCGPRKGILRSRDFTGELCDLFTGIVPPESLPDSVRIVANAGNGCAAIIAGPLFEKTGKAVHWLNAEPDSDFPAGIPNPLLPENRHSTADAVRKNKADLGLAWDGDADRCFFFDASGGFIEGYYLVGLLAEAALLCSPGSAIVHDPRLYWNTEALVLAAGGRPCMSKTGHAFIKESMRRHDAVYGGEMSAHHYFREFNYCDSGMLPWLTVLQAMKRHGKPLGDMVSERQRMFPCSGEINFEVADPKRLLMAARARYGALAEKELQIDGLSMEFKAGWRFNLRASNTEPLVRLNVESRGDAALMEEKTKEMSEMIRNS